MERCYYFLISYKHIFLYSNFIYHGTMVGIIQNICHSIYIYVTCKCAIENSVIQSCSSTFTTTLIDLNARRFGKLLPVFILIILHKYSIGSKTANC